jgi:hypothetical protein
VGDHQDGDPLNGEDVKQVTTNLRAHVCVKRIEGFVKQHGAGSRGKGAGKGDTLLLTAR